jgi:hypothetical protein
LENLRKKNEPEPEESEEEKEKDTTNPHVPKFIVQAPCNPLFLILNIVRVSKPKGKEYGSSEISYNCCH